MGSTRETTAPNQMETIKKNLFSSAMKGEWDEVVKIYKKHKEAHKVRIIRTGDTALHIAVSDYQEEIVIQLVGLINYEEGEAKKTLELKNEQGNTPLHVAATMGNVRMCDCIARIDSELVGVRNNDSETPFFLAALHGKKDAFLHLHSICGKDKGYAYCRRNDGETILHCAISGDYFDLAYQIVGRYENLVNYVNEQGLSPLHLLASKPSAFKSGSHLGRFQKIIYHCIFVDQLKTETSHRSSVVKSYKEEKNPKHPENYQTCTNLFRVLRHMIQVVTNCKKEDEPKIGGQAAGDPEGGQNNNGNAAHGHELFPANYRSCFESFKLVSKAMLIILGLGSREIIKIREKKEKHTWSVQVMNELLHHASTYEYDNIYNKGREPQQLPPSEEDETKPYEFDVEGGSVTFASDVLQEDQQLATQTPKPSSVTNQNDQNKGSEGQQPVPQTANISSETNQNNGKNDKDKNGKAVNEGIPDKAKRETTISIAAKNGVTDMVEKILNLFPSAIHDMNSEKKNAVLLTVERQPHVYQLLLKKEDITDMGKRETPILIAAKNGITEMVEKILDLFPVSIHDMNSEKKNIVLLAVENRQPHVYQLLLKRNILKESVFRKVDKEGNGALHLAARLGENMSWKAAGPMLQMQQEINWYQYVKRSMPRHSFVSQNRNYNTPREIFMETHKDLVNQEGEWLTTTSASCSVVATVIASVTFATSSTVPGGINDNGTPNLENQSAFSVFAISSLVALFFSVMAMVTFLPFATSRYRETELFGKRLPRKLLIGLTSLFISIVAMLISFCAGHFFVLKDKLQSGAFPLYVALCLPVTFFCYNSVSSLYDVILYIGFKMKVPQRRYKMIEMSNKEADL